MNFSDEDITEFRTEALDLLDQAENSLLQLDRGGDYKSHYDGIFRVFHSLKGGSGMLGLEQLQAHMHKLENKLVETKTRNQVTKSEITFFLAGVDAARKILEGNEVAFDYAVAEDKEVPTPAPPAAEPPPSTHSSAPDARVAGIPDCLAAPPTVYLVDDDPEIVEVLCDLLNGAGIKPLGFAAVVELLAEVRKKKPDLVISDYNMPNATGLELLREVRKLDPDLPVIFVSGYLSKDILIEGIRYGLFGTIEKPFRQNDLLMQCWNATKQYRLSQSLNRTMNLIMYQFSDLDDFLKSQGKEEIRKTLCHEIEVLVESRKQLKQFFTKKNT